MHLKNKREPGHNGSVESEGSAGAPACEVEVTEEMIDAARVVAQEFYYGNGEYALTDECLSRMFSEMLRVCPKFSLR